MKPIIAGLVVAVAMILAWPPLVEPASPAHEPYDSSSQTASVGRPAVDIDGMEFVLDDSLHYLATLVNDLEVICRVAPPKTCDSLRVGIWGNRRLQAWTRHSSPPAIIATHGLLDADRLARLAVLAHEIGHLISARAETRQNTELEADRLSADLLCKLNVDVLEAVGLAIGYLARQNGPAAVTMRDERHPSMVERVRQIPTCQELSNRKEGQ